MTRAALLRSLRARCAVLLALVAFLAPALAGSLGTLCIAPEHLGVAKHGGCCCEARPSPQEPSAAADDCGGPTVDAAPCEDPCCETPAHCPCIDVPGARDPLTSSQRRVEPLPAPVIVAWLDADASTAWDVGSRATVPQQPPPGVRVIPPPRSAVLRC